MKAFIFFLAIWKNQIIYVVQKILQPQKQYRKLKRNSDVLINCAKVTPKLKKIKRLKFLFKHYVIDARSSFKTIHIAFIVSKYTLTKLMTGSNGSCANNVKDGCTPRALTSIQNRIRTLFFNVLSVKKSTLNL